MKLSPTLDLLNSLLESELMALEYYRIHAESIKEPDILEGIEAILPAEHSHAVTLTTRIMELGGVPVRPGGPASVKGRAIGQATKAQGTLGMLKLELAQEKLAIKDYAGAIAEIDDAITLDVLEEQLLDEIRHAKWLKQQIINLAD